ncbi:MAG: putative porin, partial [Bacteroidota bacterium]
MQALRFTLFLFLVPLTLLAQRPTGGGIPPTGGNIPGQRQQGDYKEENPDTATIYYFYADAINEKIRFVDTLLGNYFEQFDPTRKRDLEYGHLGTVGTAARPLVFSPQLHQGVEVGLNQFDLYREDAKLKFFKVHKAFTDVYYSQGGEQNDGYFKLNFARNFANGIKLSLHHERIYHLTTETPIQQNGSYLPQRTRYTIFGAGLWYHAKNEKYDGFLSYQSDVMEHADHGGITSESEAQLLAGSVIDFTLNTHLESASTRHDHSELAYQHYYRLAAKKDSTGTTRRAFNFAHKIALKNSTYKYADDSQELSTEVYNPFPIDSRGMRHFIDLRTIDNHFRINTNRDARSGGGDLLEVGLRHSFHQLNLEPIDSSLNNLYLTAKLNFSLKDRLRLNTYGHYGILANGGDYRLDGTLFVDLAKAGQLEVKAVSQRYTPTLMQQKLFINKTEFWRNDFKKPIENSVSATYTTPKFPISLTGRINLLDNHIYFDSLGLAQQNNGAISVFQSIEK